MASKGQLKLLTDFLNIPDVKVTNFIQDPSLGIILSVASLTSEVACPHCGKMSHKLHHNYSHLIKDLPMNGQSVYLQVNKRQMKCEHCLTTFSEPFDFCQPKRNYTKRLADDILSQVKHSNIKSVAERTGVSESEIETMLKDFKKTLVGQKPKELKRLGIDEISLIKGQGNYCAVLVDLDNNKLLALVPDRTQSAIEKVLMSWGIDVLSGIEEVSIDLWRPYKSLVEKLMPNAEVVADRFHVMHQVQEELDNGRKQAKKEVNNMKQSNKKTAKIKAITHGKYVLLANSDNFTEAQKTKLEEINKEFPKLQKMHGLKEQLREIFERDINWFDGLLDLAEWLKKSADLFPKSQGTIRRWLVEITAYFEQRTTNGIVEGINQKIKLVKRCGFGFRNIDNFELRCLLAFQD